MTFGTHNRVSKTNIRELAIDGNPLQEAADYKYLGVTLDQHLNYKKHVKGVIKTSSHKTYLHRHVRKNTNQATSLLIYQSMIRPYIEYGDVIYSACPQNLLKRLQVIQNSNLKTVLQKDRLASTEGIHRDTKMNKLKDRRNSNLLSFMFNRAQNPRYLDAPPIRT